MASDAGQENNNVQRMQPFATQARLTHRVALLAAILASSYVGELSAMEPMPAEAKPIAPAVAPEARLVVDIDTELGQLQVEFFTDKAPAAVAELASLAKSGYFNSDTLLEIRPGLGFVIARVGTSAKSYHVTDEPNILSSQRGSIAISKSSVSVAYLNNIFIGFQGQPELEKHYIIIGQVTKGLTLIEKSTPGVRYKVNGFKLIDSEQKQALQAVGVSN